MKKTWILRKNEHTKMVFLEDGITPGFPLFKDMSIREIGYIDPSWEMARYIRNACNEKEKEKK